MVENFAELLGAHVGLSEVCNGGFQLVALLRAAIRVQDACERLLPVVVHVALDFVIPLLLGLSEFDVHPGNRAILLLSLGVRK